MNGANIAVISAFAPYPLRSCGVAMRYAPVLDRLSERHQVNLLLLDFDDASHSDPGQDAPEWFRHARHIPVSRWRPKKAGLLRRLQSLSLSGPPVDYRVKDVEGLCGHLESQIRAMRADIVLWIGPAIYGLALHLMKRRPAARFVIDFVDSPTLFLQRVRYGRVFPAMRSRWHISKIAELETALRLAADQSIYISPVDAGAVETSRRPCVIPNGVSLAATVDHLAGRYPEIPTLGFLGDFSYGPNRTAALRLHDDIFAPLQRDDPALKLLLIGRGPGPEITALRSDRTHVTGEVASIWPSMSEVSIFVFPLTSGAGLQNKLLEALAMARPVVTTTMVARSAGVEHEQHVLIADTDEQFRAAIRSLLTQGKSAHELGRRGRNFVLARYEWDAILPQFEAAIAGCLTPAACLVSGGRG